MSSMVLLFVSRRNVCAKTADSKSEQQARSRAILLIFPFCPEAGSTSLWLLQHLIPFLAWPNVFSGQIDILQHSDIWPISLTSPPDHTQDSL